MLIPDDALERIVALGERRRPLEACGLLLADGRVVEAPNRAREPRDSYEIYVEDLAELDDAGEFEGADWSDPRAWAIWHTHPSGFVGPSRDDMRSRQADLSYLVVALPEDGEPIAAQY